MSETRSFLDSLDTPGGTALRAWLDGHARRVNTFLTVDQPWGPEQWMPLHLAAARGRVDAVALLLERGRHPDCRTRYVTPMHARHTPLHLATVGGHGDVARRLLEAGAEVEARDAQQRSALWLAARHQHAALVMLLCDRGALPEARDTQGRTPLHAALLLGAAEALVPVSVRGDTTLPAEPTVSQRSETLAAMLSFNVEVNATCPRDADGFTPLHRAVSLGDVALPLVDLLLRCGADPALADPRHHRIPADLARQRGDTTLAGRLA